MSDLSQTGFEFALSRHTRSIEQDNWQVGAGATTTVIPVALANPSGVGVGLTVGVQQRIQGTVCEFISGQNQGQSAAVANCAANGTLTLDAALPVAPASGDRFILLRSVNVTVEAAENVAQVGGQIVPSPGGVASLPTTNAPQSIASVGNGSAVAANGPLLLADYIVPANGSIVFCVTLALGAASSVLQVSRNATAGTPFYGQLNSGSALMASIEFDANIPVKQGDVIQFELVTATTLGWAEFAYIPQQ